MMALVRGGRPPLPPRRALAGAVVLQERRRRDRQGRKPYVPQGQEPRPDQRCRRHCDGRGACVGRRERRQRLCDRPSRRVHLSMMAAMFIPR